MRKANGLFCGLDMADRVSTFNLHVYLPGCRSNHTRFALRHLVVWVSTLSSALCERCM